MYSTAQMLCTAVWAVWAEAAMLHAANLCSIGANPSLGVLHAVQDRSLFPIDLVVTKLSGTGSDAVFLGILRVAADEDTQLVSIHARRCVNVRLKQRRGTSEHNLLADAVVSFSWWLHS